MSTRNKIISLVSLYFIILGTSISNATVISTCSKSQLNTIKDNKVCKKVDILYRWVDIQNTPIIPISVPTKQIEPTQSATPVIKNISVAEKAFNLLSIDKTSVIKNTTYEILSSNNFPKDVFDKYSQVSKNTIAYWDKSIAPNSEVHVLMVSEKDRDFLSLQLSRYSSSSYIFSGIDSALKNYETYGASYSPGGTTTSVYFNSKQIVLVIIYASSKHTLATAQIDLPAHELTHAYQFFETFNMQKQGSNLLSCMSFEGGANSFAALITSNNYSEYELALKNIGSRSKKVISSQSEMYSSLVAADTWDANCNYGYSLGTFLYEELTYDFGSTAYRDIFDHIKYYGSYYESFYKTTGKTVQQYYQEKSADILALYNK